MSDAGHDYADRAVDSVMASSSAAYLNAQAEAERMLLGYLDRYKTEDEKKRRLVEQGKMTKVEYKSWRRKQIAAGEKYRKMLERIAVLYKQANETTMEALDSKLPDVYAENANYATYETMIAAGVAFAYGYVMGNAIRERIEAGERLYARPGVNAAKDVAWNRQLLHNQIAKGIELGESMDKIASRIQNVTNSNYTTALRTARTMVTAAENAARIESYKNAKKIGVPIKGKRWMASLDNRTRHSHRLVDGEIVDIDDGVFSNGCRYPGDPNASYSEIMNCRCTMVVALEDDNEDHTDLSTRWSRLPQGMTYEQWKVSGAVKLDSETYLALARAADSLLSDAEKLGANKRVQGGAIAGALNNLNDPSGKKRRNHAKAYYEEVRNRDKTTEVAAVASNAGVDVGIVSAAYDHLFIDFHELEAGLKRFDEDFEIAMSWQRMREGSRIENHDATLLYHEAYEAKLMEGGLPYSQAHEKAQKVYNYAGQVDEYLLERGKSDGIR